MNTSSTAKTWVKLGGPHGCRAASVLGTEMTGASSGARRSNSLWVILLGWVGVLNGCTDYTHRARSEVVDAMSGAFEMQMISNEIYASEGRFPDDREMANYRISAPRHGRYTRQVTGSKGVVQVLFTDAAVKPLRGTSLRFEPSVTADFTLQWRCRSDDIDPNYLPANCRLPVATAGQ